MQTKAGDAAVAVLRVGAAAGAQTSTGAGENAGDLPGVAAVRGTPLAHRLKIQRCMDAAAARQSSAEHGPAQTSAAQTRHQGCETWAVLSTIMQLYMSMIWRLLSYGA